MLQEGRARETQEALESAQSQHELVAGSLNDMGTAPQQSMQQNMQSVQQNMQSMQQNMQSMPSAEPSEQYASASSHQRPVAQLVSVHWHHLCARQY